MEPDILENGKVALGMDEVQLLGLMELNTKASGSLEGLLGTAGLLMQMEMSMWDIGSETKQMELVCILVLERKNSLLAKENTKANGKMTDSMGRALRNGKMEATTKVSLSRERRTVLEGKFGVTALTI